ncbi:MAG: glycosyltransferase family 39 protein, partial [Planctomycetaceae bacterium]
LGIAGEWTWERILWNDQNRAEALWGVCLALIAGALYVGFAFWGTEYFPSSDALHGTKQRRVRAGLWLCGLWIVANGWVLALQQSPPEPYNLTKAAWVTYYPSASGYFFHARYRIVEPSSFLAKYEAWMREGDVLHVGTHPPGLYLLNFAVLRLCERSPVLTEAIIASTPGEIERGLDDVNRHLRASPRELRPSDRAALWGMILFTQAVALAAVFPLYALVRHHFSSQTAWQAATLWPLIPALNVFLPKSDTLYPFVTLLLIWCALQAVRRNSWLWGCCAGFVLWIGLTMSLALLPGLVLTTLLIAWELLLAHRSGPNPAHEPAATTPDGKRRIAPLAAMGATFVCLVTAVWWLADLNLWNCWRLNLQNHAGFYAHYSRTYWKWLLVNPLE